LICIPFLTTMLYMPPERRTTFGVNENTVRLSAGIEHDQTLLNDLQHALSDIQTTSKTSPPRPTKERSSNRANLRV